MTGAGSVVEDKSRQSEKLTGIQRSYPFYAEHAGNVFFQQAGYG